MVVARIVDADLADLALVASSTPNERLPKEERFRCCIYAAIPPAVPSSLCRARLQINR